MLLYVSRKNHVICKGGCVFINGLKVLNSEHSKAFTDAMQALAADTEIDDEAFDEVVDAMCDCAPGVLISGEGRC